MIFLPSSLPVYIFGESFVRSFLKNTCSGFSVMVCGAIWSLTPQALVECPSNINAAKYILILQEGLPSILFSRQMVKDTIYFIQVCIPSYATKVTQAWLEQNGVKVLPWPSQSMDMNTIDQVWTSLDRLWVTGETCFPWQLLKLLHSSWREILQLKIENHITSKPNIPTALKNAKGALAKYWWMHSLNKLTTTHTPNSSLLIFLVFQIWWVSIYLLWYVCLYLIFIDK